jgi:hypothetical protein
MPAFRQWAIALALALTITPQGASAQRPQPWVDPPAELATPAERQEPGAKGVPSGDPSGTLRRNNRFRGLYRRRPRVRRARNRMVPMTWKCRLEP